MSICDYGNSVVINRKKKASEVTRHACTKQTALHVAHALAHAHVLILFGLEDEMDLLPVTVFLGALKNAFTAFSTFQLFACATRM